MTSGKSTNEFDSRSWTVIWLISLMLSYIPISDVNPCKESEFENPAILQKLNISIHFKPLKTKGKGKTCEANLSGRSPLYEINIMKSKTKNCQQGCKNEASHYWSTHQRSDIMFFHSECRTKHSTNGSFQSNRQDTPKPFITEFV